MLLGRRKTVRLVPETQIARDTDSTLVPLLRDRWCSQLSTFVTEEIAYEVSRDAEAQEYEPALRILSGHASQNPAMTRYPAVAAHRLPILKPEFGLPRPRPLLVRRSSRPGRKPHPLPGNSRNPPNPPTHRRGRCECVIRPARPSRLARRPAESQVRLLADGRIRIRLLHRLHGSLRCDLHASLCVP